MVAGFIIPRWHHLYVNSGLTEPSVKELGPAVRLSQSDINEIKKAMADGIEFEVRQVASEKKRIVTSFDL